MMKKLLISMALAATASFADFYFEYSEPNATPAASGTALECAGDSVDLAIRKRELVKQFNTCVNERTEYSISIMMFKVKEGEYGADKQAECFKAYADSLNALATCAETILPGRPFFSLEERLAYRYYFGIYGGLVQYFKNYKQIQEDWNGKQSVDPYDISDEKAAVTAVPFEKIEAGIAEWEGSREDKDMLTLYYKYLRSTYDWPYKCSIKPAFICDTSWLGEEKTAFLNKYPESEYREFVETQMPGFAEPTAEEKANREAGDKLVDKRQSERALEEVKAARDVWVALSGIAMFGIPVTSTTGFDDNYDASTMMSLAFKASWRSVVLQYQYHLAFGDNNKGGSVAEKGYSIMGGVMLGPKKTFTVDLLFGLTYLDTYAKEEGISANINYESYAFAVQGTYYFPISDSWDVTAHVQARMNYIENFCRANYWDEEDGRCTDPGRGGEPQDHSWEDLQWTFSAGIGIRFWKPRY